MRTIAAHGWPKSDIRKYIFENTTSTIAHLKRTARLPGAIKAEDETATRPLVLTPDDILVVAAGGRARSFPCYIPGWGSRRTSQAGDTELQRESGRMQGSA